MNGFSPPLRPRNKACRPARFACDPQAPCDASGAWLADGSFFIRIDLPGERPGSVTAQLSFQNGCVTALMHCREELGYPGWEETASAALRPGETGSWAQRG